MVKNIKNTTDNQQQRIYKNVKIPTVENTCAHSLQKAQHKIHSNTKGFVIQSYSFTIAHHAFRVVDLRIAAKIIQFLGKRSEKYKDIVEYDRSLTSEQGETISKAFYRIDIEESEVVVSDNYYGIKIALERLRTLPIEIYNTDTRKETVLSFISEYERDDKGRIALYVSQTLMPHLINVSRNFTRFELDFCFKTQSRYAIRLHQIACHWLDRGFFTMTVENMRKIFGINDNEYFRHTNFKRYIVDNPVKDINKHSSMINISTVKQIKKGRSVIGYTFCVDRKKDNPYDVIKNTHNLVPRIGGWQEQFYKKLKDVFGWSIYKSWFNSNSIENITVKDKIITLFVTKKFQAFYINQHLLTQIEREVVSSIFGNEYTFEAVFFVKNK